jgi:hypothetical protein
LNLKITAENPWRMNMKQRNQITHSNQSSTPPFPIKERLLTQTEAANLLHVEPRTLESWRHSTGPVHVTFAIRGVVSVIASRISPPG